MRNEESDPEIVNDEKEFRGNPYMRPYTKREQKEALKALKKLGKTDEEPSA